MSKIFTSLSIVFLCMGLFLSLQSEAQSTFGLRIDYFTDYHLNPIFYNPAFAGKEDHAKMGLSLRDMKAGTATPKSAQGFIHGQIDAINSGVGLMINYHTFGDNFKRRQMKVGMLYSYTIYEGETGVFKVGLTPSLLHYNSDFVPNSSGSVDVVRTNESFFKFNLDGSVLYLNGDFYMGVTMFHTNEPRFEFYNIGSLNRFQKEAYITLGQTIDVGTNITLHPAVMVNFTLNQTTIDFNNAGFIDLSLLGRFQDKFLAGVSYKANQAPYKLAFTGGVKLNDQYQIAATYHLKQANFLNRNRIGLTLNYFLPTFENEEEIIEE